MNPAGHPELILLNGRFRTQDPGRPLAEAAVVQDGCILAVGDNATIAALASARCQRIDLQRKLALPGFMDSHIHFYDWALSRLNLNLAAMASLAHLLDAVRIAAVTKPTAEWIVGVGFNETDWPENRLPTRAELDVAAPDHPVALWRCDLHLAVVNSKTLELAGIGSATPDPPGGIVSRDGEGRPNGILRELAVNLIKNIMPKPGHEEVLAAMRVGMAALHSMGITAVHDFRLMGGLEGAAALTAWQRLRQSGDLNLRCWVTLPGEHLEEAIALGLRTGFGDECLRIGHVKFFADGGMGARTAWMIDPYLDAGWGMPLIPMDQLEQKVFNAECAGLSAAVHAVGDRTNHELIRMFAKLQVKRGNLADAGRDRPALAHRIEHLQMVRAEDLARLAQLDVVASMQPHNAILDMAMIDACVGRNGRYTYAFGEVMANGIPVCFSSDAPVCDPSPLVGIHAAVTRQGKDGRPPGGWYPNQRVSVAQAVRSYTRTPAWASGVDHEQGSITPGKRADIVILDRDIYEIDPMDIINARIILTVFDGRIVHRAADI
jgi:hypothetical protein